MTKRKLVKYALMGALALGTAFTAGCAGRTATFTVTRPAMMNAAAVGNTMQVDGMQAPTGLPQDVQAAAEIVADLQQRIANSLNRSIRLVQAGGGVTITGMVVANNYMERMERNTRQCTRSVPYTNSQGQTSYRTETYQCTDLRRIGQAQVQLHFTITRAADQAVIFDQNYQDQANVVTTGIQSAYENRHPDPIDGMGLLHNVRSRLVEEFAHVILPWNENVTVRFEDCDGEAACRQAYDAVAQRNDLNGAEALFTQVIGTYANASQAVPPNLAEKIGEALYNRGLVRMYNGRYAQAVADITRAIALRPDESDWQQNLQEAQRMARDQEALRQQGATSNETQNVQQAGTP